MGKHQEDGCELHKLDGTALNKLIHEKFKQNILRIVQHLIANPDKLENFKEYEFYDLIKDVDWKSAINADWDEEKDCVVIVFPRTATIKID